MGSWGVISIQFPAPPGCIHPNLAESARRRFANRQAVKSQLTKTVADRGIPRRTAARSQENSGPLKRPVRQKHPSPGRFVSAAWHRIAAPTSPAPFGMPKSARH
jgi:hypothetical protein